MLADPAAIHAGTLTSTAAVVLGALDLLINVWHQRKADPTMLVQSAGQWSSVLDRPLFNFPGYTSGETIKLPTSGVVRVSPDTGRRMQATGVFHDAFWPAD